MMKNQFVKNQIELGSTETMEPETSFNLSDNKTNIINLCVSNPALADPKTQLGRPTQTCPKMRQKSDILGMIVFVIFPQKVAIIGTFLANCDTSYSSEVLVYIW